MKHNKTDVSSELRTEKLSPGLRSRFTPLGIWAFSIGASIGWGSFIVACNTYLQKSGVLGTVFGMLLGMAIIFVITWNLQYMVRKAPDAGGIYTFQKRVGGKDLGFLAFWFVLLTYLAVLWANMTSLPLFARFFLGNSFQFGFRYSIFGYRVWFGEALLSICAVVLIGLLCANATRLINHIMSVAALTFTVGFTVCAVIAILRHDSAFSYSPLYMEESGAFAQIIRITAISPWAFIGFENVAHFSEEYDFPVRKVRGILIGSVLLTTLLYLFVSLLSVSAYPPEYDSWLAYIRDMGNLEGIKAVPAFYAANYYLGQTGVTVLMLALFTVILTSLIANLLALSRLLYAAGREGEAPRMLSKLSGRGIPTRAIIAVVAVSALIPFLGRTAIGWIVDVTTLGATIIYWLISHAVFRHAQQEGQRLEQCTGFAGILLMTAFLLLLLIPGLLPFHAMETVSYILFIVWAVLGLGYFRVLIRRDQNREYKQRVIVWIILLILMLFASIMWVSRATESAANNAVKRIFEYHESHPTDDSDPNVREERASFLREQAKAISSANSMYSVLSLGLFVIVVSMMLNNYRETQRLGARLTEAENEAIAAKKITELKQTISSLLDNMPGMTFTKDAKTGVYLACNQAFANYAHKDNPDGVVGPQSFNASGAWLGAGAQPGVGVDGRWSKENGAWYYYDANNNRVTGLTTVKGKVYYLDPTSSPQGKMLTGIVTCNDGQKRYFNADGAMETGWKQLSGVWYYFNPSGGVMQTGWVQSKGKWYYMDQVTGGMKTGWVEDPEGSGIWYYLDPNDQGAMHKGGWMKLGGKWYYLNPNADGTYGRQIQGWVQDGGYTYYMQASTNPAEGWMLTGGPYVIDGKTCTFDDSGHLISQT